MFPLCSEAVGPPDVALVTRTRIHPGKETEAKPSKERVDFIQAGVQQWRLTITTKARATPSDNSLRSMYIQWYIYIYTHTSSYVILILFIEKHWGRILTLNQLDVRDVACLLGLSDLILPLTTALPAHYMSSPAPFHMTY